jgi:hypothetical protein
MKTSEIKKGMRVKLDNGWYGTMMDNMRGTTRMVEVEGYYTEIGSVYSYDIALVLPIKGGIWETIEYTEKELKVKAMNMAIFG